MLDIGGRKSPYTIGLSARVFITDLPRTSRTQRQLNLGIHPKIARSLLARRSNIRGIAFDDMTQSSLRQHAFDCVVSVEVLEHVERDRDFLTEVHRVLTPGGTFLMTTPNGDYRSNTNPDHKRHYRRGTLLKLLRERFDEVEVFYAVKGGIFHRWGLPAWSFRRPLRTVRAMVGNLLSRWQSRAEKLKDQAHGTHHLIAIARRRTVPHGAGRRPRFSHHF